MSIFFLHFNFLHFKCVILLSILHKGIPMPKLDLSSLNTKNLHDMYYIESLSLDNLPVGALDNINKSFKQIRKDVGKNFQIHFNGSLEAFDLQKNNLDYQFQAHDCFDPDIKVSSSKDLISLKTIGFSFKNNKEYDINIEFSKLRNFKSELYTYSKGLLKDSRKCYFDIVFSKKHFLFRDLLIIENEKLEPEIKMVFVYDKNVRHSDLGNRDILILSFTPDTINAQYTEILQTKNKYCKK
jgi:hypothetical protein